MVIFEQPPREQTPTQHCGLPLIRFESETDSGMAVIAYRCRHCGKVWIDDMVTVEYRAAGNGEASE